MYQDSEIFGKIIQKKVKEDGITPSAMEKRMQRIKIGTRIHLNYIGFSKSKNDRISVYFRTPLCKESAAANAVIMPVLLSGSKKYPDLTAISEKLQELYGADEAFALEIADIKAQMARVRQFLTASPHTALHKAETPRIMNR